MKKWKFRAEVPGDSEVFLFLIKNYQCYQDFVGTYTKNRLDDVKYRFFENVSFDEEMGKPEPFGYKVLDWHILYSADGSDEEVEFTTEKWTYEELTYVAWSFIDGHILADSLKPIELYNGKRDNPCPNDVELKPRIN